MLNKLIESLKNNLQRVPLFVLLLPVFFVLHGYLENFGFINGWDCLLLAVTYLFATLLFYFIFYLLYRNHVKTALIVTFLFSFYFFFGIIHDFFYSHKIFLRKYSVILPLFTLVAVVLVIYLRKAKNKFLRITLFLNTLFLIYMLVDTAGLVLRSLHPNPDKFTVYTSEKKNFYRQCDTCPNPNIYFLLFDEYTSSASLKQWYNYNNAGLDTFLLERGFHIQYRSISNYNRTSFSMASMLNMSYLQGIRDINACTIDDYARCNLLVSNNEVIHFLSSRQYDIVNYSIFDLAGNPSIVNQSLLPLKTNLITGRTLSYRFGKDIGWHFNTYLPPLLKWFNQDFTYQNQENNVKFIDYVKNESRKRSIRPRFVYAHFLMPHPPFYYDKYGKLRNFKELMETPDYINGIGAYCEYVAYTNGKIKELITAIQENTQGSAVIILMGDHGYKCDIPDPLNLHYFQNLNAVYFPDNDYHLLYDSITGVNQFRVIFNKLFGQEIPLLKDSTVFLVNKK